jgi:hypothetical protein
MRVFVILLCLVVMSPLVFADGGSTERPAWNDKMCPKGIEEFGSLIYANPYDNTDRCFSFVGKPVQLLGRSTALFSFETGRIPGAFINLKGESVPMNFLSTFVIGRGAYRYQTVDGSQNIVHSLDTVPKSKERAAWDKVEQDKIDLAKKEADLIRAKNLAIWEAEAPVRLEQERKLREFNMRNSTK